MKPTLLLDLLLVDPSPGTLFWGLLVLFVIPLLIGGIALVRWTSGKSLNGKDALDL